MPSFEVERLSVDPSRSTASAVFVPRVNEPHQPTDDKAAEDIQHHEENTSSPPMHKQQDEHTSFLGSRSPAQPPSPSEAAGDRRGEVLLGWWVEFLALLAGIGAFLAIALILSKYDQHEQPNWRYGLNLNTIIAILSTLLRSSLLAVVAEGKWFSEPA